MRLFLHTFILPIHALLTVACHARNPAIFRRRVEILSPTFIVPARALFDVGMAASANGS